MGYPKYYFAASSHKERIRKFSARARALHTHFIYQLCLVDEIMNPKLRAIKSLEVFLLRMPTSPSNSCGCRTHRWQFAHHVILRHKMSFCFHSGTVVRVDQQPQSSVRHPVVLSFVDVEMKVRVPIATRATPNTHRFKTKSFEFELWNTIEPYSRWHSGFLLGCHT